MEGFGKWCAALIWSVIVFIAGTAIQYGIINSIDSVYNCGIVSSLTAEQAFGILTIIGLLKFKTPKDGDDEFNLGESIVKFITVVLYWTVIWGIALLAHVIIF